MQHVAALIETWVLQRRDAAIVRPIRTDGLGPRPTGDLLLVDSGGRTAGALLGGAAHDAAVAAARDLLASTAPHATVQVSIEDGDASAAGLTCGGRAELLIHRLDVVPTALWDDLAARRAAALVTVLGRDTPPMMVRPDRTVLGSLDDSGLETLAAAEVERLLSHVGPSVERLSLGSVEVVIEAWNPAPHVLIVGASDLSAALTRQADLLGWIAETVVGAEAAERVVRGLGPSDVVVVLDHDPFVATPVLAAALGLGVGYVGALVRRTQAMRRQHLRDVGVRDVEIDQLHGPTGLDIGSRTPAETAVSIVAEIIAARSDRTGAPLTGSAGRITG